jgi:hypothetical protein
MSRSASSQESLQKHLSNNQQNNFEIRNKMKLGCSELTNHIIQNISGLHIIAGMDNIINL